MIAYWNRLLIVVQEQVYDFFFQAEDGIRDGHVTGVQTCALPILPFGCQRRSRCKTEPIPETIPREPPREKIGRASCREREQLEEEEEAEEKREETISGEKEDKKWDDRDTDAVNAGRARGVI